MRVNPGTAPSVGFVSLGCPKALVDSERILTRLRADGYRIAPSYGDADLVVVNTCGFIDSAREESLDAIGEALDENGRVIVTGCLGAVESTIRERHPKVLSVTGPHQTDALVAEVHRFLPPPDAYDPRIDLMPPQGVKLTPSHYAYLKISEGCNHKCTFCIIPDLRGKLLSRRPGEILREAETLVRSGVRELLIVSQDTSAYGADLGFSKDQWRGNEIAARMLDLCRELGRLDAWVRLHYVYPYPHVDAIVDLMAEGGILPYMDIPLQHGSPRILKLMRRPAATDDTLERIGRWRERCPDLALRSSFIVGFPGETDKDFELLLDFLREAQLDRVGCFEYSAVHGARANDLPGAVPETLRKERWHRFMQAQQAISRERLQGKVGRHIEVIVDEVHADHAVARSHADAPEIDGIVRITDGAGLSVGQVLDVCVQAADDYDLTATLAGT